MAAKFGLADVQPMRKEWSAATVCVRVLVRNKVLRMVVRKEGMKAMMSSKVMMYSWNVKEHDCVNLQLVHEDHAKLTKRFIKRSGYGQ